MLIACESVTVHRLPTAPCSLPQGKDASTCTHSVVLKEGTAHSRCHDSCAQSVHLAICADNSPCQKTCLMMCYSPSACADTCIVRRGSNTMRLMMAVHSLCTSSCTRLTKSRALGLCLSGGLLLSRCRLCSYRQRGRAAYNMSDICYAQSLQSVWQSADNLLLSDLLEHRAVGPAIRVC